MQIKKEQLLLIAVGSGSFSVGILVGHILARYLPTKVEKDKEELESKEVENDFKRAELDKEFNWKIQQASTIIGKFNDSIQRLDNTVDQLNDDGEVYLGRFTKEKEPENESENNLGVRMHELQEVDPPVVTTYHETEGEEWDYKQEFENRASREDPREPYTIHRDEFFENPDDHRQSTLTYYQGDNILCDELDGPIYNPEQIVGKLEFGRGSQDPNVVYVRNEHLFADYEVLLDPGYFQVEVLGGMVQDILKSHDLKHSVPKFRMD